MFANENIKIVWNQICPQYSYTFSVLFVINFSLKKKWIQIEKYVRKTIINKV